jgi:hypothetical protein
LEEFSLLVFYQIVLLLSKKNGGKRIKNGVIGFGGNEIGASYQ